MHATTTQLHHDARADDISCQMTGNPGFTGHHPAPRSLPRSTALAGILLALALTGGCSAYLEEPVAEWREPLGEAFHAQREQQRLNPAPVDASPVTGLDGQAVERSMKVYRQGEDKKQENGNTFQFKFGNAKSKQ